MKSPADRDRQHLWHPFAPMAEWLSEPPLVIDRAEGNELIDVEGRRYLDGIASLWVNVHGHRHPHIDAAVRAQLDRVAHSTLLGLGSTTTTTLAEKLVAVAPAGLERVFFSDSGSTAVEVALKIAFQHHRLTGAPQRTKFLAISEAYHGDTIGSVSLGGIDLFHQLFHPLLFHTLRCRADLSSFEDIFLANKNELAAVVMEPLVQGAAGMRLMPDGLLRAAATLCRRHGVLLIADEVATGFGRTGTMFACEQEHVTPDLLCVAKGLSGGYLPVAATLATPAVFEPFVGPPLERRTFFHGHSFGGNPLGCAAAIASLEVFERERTIGQLPDKIERFRRLLAEHIAPLPHVAEIRQRGLMIGIELRRDRRTPYPESVAIGARACRFARAHGVILRPLGPVVVLMPPLSITPDQIDHLVTATAASIAQATNGAVDETSPLPPARPATVATRSAVTARSTPRGLVLVGTDTAVGKTTVGRALLALARRGGLEAHPVKPVETGCDPTPADASALRAAAGSPLPLERICPFRFHAPVAPSVAAAAEGRTVALSDLAAAVASVRQEGPVIVETAGGLLSPLTSTDTNADLVTTLGLPVLVVARNALGTINHTALTVAELRRRGATLLGLVLVDTATAGLDAATNGHEIERLTGLRPLGTLSFLGCDPDDAALARAFEQTIDADRVLAALR